LIRESIHSGVHICLGVIQVLVFFLSAANRKTSFIGSLD